MSHGQTILYESLSLLSINQCLEQHELQDHIGFLRIVM